MDTFNHIPKGRRKKSVTRLTNKAKVLAILLLLCIPSISRSSNLIAILPQGRDDSGYQTPRSRASNDLSQPQEEEHAAVPEQAQQAPDSASANQLQVYNADAYEHQLQEAMEVLPDIETASYVFEFYSGLNNQLMRFLGILSLAASEGYRQYLDPSILWKDTFGTNEKISHHKLWDVAHWNTFYPNVPRLVKYDPKYHPHVMEVGKVIEMEGGIRIKVPEVTYNVTWDVWENRSITKPAPSGQNRHQSLNSYNQMMRFHDRNSNHPEKTRQFSFYKPMIAGALKPHPFLQHLVDREKAKLGAGGKFMAFHARVEPDMARQDRVCTSLKVWNLTEILDGIYKQFPEPPVNTVLMQFNRKYMEDESKRTTNIDKYTVLNHQNLKVINRVVNEGMWDGRVNVVEAGSSLVEEAGDPFYKRYSSISGGIVNMFLAIHSDIFIGTEVSTYSVIAANARFHRGLLENYFFVPEGLKEVARTKQYRFAC
ncbi:unnamed protein product [Cylindrotheca closterium]|uniref:O-fucosyltransferase family protein n=1 Tax=Cylindrotheca closterium TaxID=2856 RepID=A0AAD2PXS4_9STRA|nr:unnamed protein product [Cylindrotheca closterium]